LESKRANSIVTRRSRNLLSWLREILKTQLEIDLKILTTARSPLAKHILLQSLLLPENKETYVISQLSKLRFENTGADNGRKFEIFSLNIK
jgi:hypothetical protein